MWDASRPSFPHWVRLAGQEPLGRMEGLAEREDCHPHALAPTGRLCCESSRDNLSFFFWSSGTHIFVWK